MRISEQKIEEIRAAADIVDVVSGFVRLRKAGRNYQGLCPFHKEKTPSFNVNPALGIFKCFGCGRGGNAITFLMEVERVSFVEAVRELAERYHIDLPQEGVQERRDSTSLDALYHAARVAARFFYDTLRSDRGAAGTAYLAGRKWSDATLTTFGVGYAPDAWQALLQHATANGVTEDALEQSGLIIRKESGRTYDRFRNRIVFPIFSVTRKVIGFGARALSPDDMPKYLNSPETPIYAKSTVLYGLAQAHRAIRDANAAVLVEGYADVLSMHQAGVTNTIATSGTALTGDQLRVLARYTSTLYFLYDADAAGTGAMVRGLDLMLARNLDPRIVRLPKGEDPDSFIRASGADALRAELARATSFLEFLVGDYDARGVLHTPEGKTDAIRHVIGLLARVPDRIKRELYIHHLAARFRVYESVLYAELEQLLRTRSREELREAQAPHVRAEADDENGTAGNDDAPRAEVEFLRELLDAPPDVRSEILGAVAIGQFQHPLTASLMHLILEQHEHVGVFEPLAIEREIGENVELMHLFAGLLVPRRSVSERWSAVQTVAAPDHRRALLDAYKRLLVTQVDEEVASLRRRLRTQAVDDPGTPLLLERISHYDRLRLEILSARTFESLPHVEAGPASGAPQAGSPF